MKFDHVSIELDDAHWHHISAGFDFSINEERYEFAQWLSQLVDLPQSYFAVRLQSTAEGKLFCRAALTLEGEEGLKSVERQITFLEKIPSHEKAENLASTFWNDCPDLVCSPQLDSYRIGKGTILCEFTLLRLLDCLDQSDELVGRSWSMQFCLNSFELSKEAKRAVQKNLLELEDARGLPSSIFEWQTRTVDAWLSNQLEAFEMVGADDPETLNFLCAVVEKEFRCAFAARGFEKLTWYESSEDLMLAWSLGLTPSAFLAEEEILFPNRISQSVLAAVSNWEPSQGKGVFEYVDKQHSSFDVFISYSTSNVEKAKAVCCYLEDSGLKCWIAPRNIQGGKLWPEEIVRGIENSQLTLLLLSSTSSLSPYVLRELELSVKNERPIIPLRLEDCRVSRSIEFFLTSHQWIDFHPNTLESYFPELLKTLKALLRNPQRRR